MVRTLSFDAAPSPSHSRCGCVLLHSSPMCCATRSSQVTSNKVEGYYRLPDAKRIVIDEACYEIRTMRGSGPGGQGTNSSSNKVEMRVDLELLALSLEALFNEVKTDHDADGSTTCADIIRQLKRNEKLEERHSERSANVLIVSSHEHRSAWQNKEACLDKVREKIRKASWVPPVPADPIETPSHTITQKKNERRKKSNINRMRRTARQGLW